MTVAELRSLLSDLAKFLRASEGAKVAGELEYISERLAPFTGYKLKAFADFLTQAEAYSRGALLPKPPGRKASTRKDPAAIDEACQRVLELYQRATDPATTVEEIEMASRTLEHLDPPRAKLDEVLTAMGGERKLKNKADVLKAIRQKVLGRKGAFDRPEA